VHVYCTGACHIHSWCWCYIPQYCRWGCVWIDRCYYTGQSTPGAPTAAPETGGSKPAGTPGAAASEGAAAPAILVIDLPEDARLTVQGAAMTARGPRRRLISPALEPGRDYLYTLQGEFSHNGQTRTVTRDVVVRAGEETAVDLNSPAVVLAAR
jgi:uncharacterized protein (TIGR03000 family)